MQYFTWKKDYSVSVDLNFCEICEYLLRVDVERSKSKVIDDIYKWWSTGGKCNHDLVTKLTEKS